MCYQHRTAITVCPNLVPTLPRIQAMIPTNGIWQALPTQPCHRAMRDCGSNQANSGRLDVADTVRRRANGTPKANQKANDQIYYVAKAFNFLTSDADTVRRTDMGSYPQSLFLVDGRVATDVRRHARGFIPHGYYGKQRYTILIFAGFFSRSFLMNVDIVVQFVQVIG